MKTKWILFTSYAPGTGKTQKMIEYAISLMDDYKVEWGIINDFYRKYEANRVVLDNCIGKVCLEKKFVVELDIYNVIKRHPDFIVIDEMGYFNKKTGRKLSNDIAILIENGINVITSCNLQLFNSINKHCRKIAGISINCTIDDEILDYITDIYYIDCEPYVVWERYSNGELFPHKNRLLDRYLCENTLKEYRNLTKSFIKEKSITYIT